MGAAAANSKAYVKGKPTNVEQVHHHVMPIKTYLQVFGALLFLTVITVLVSYANLGPLALGVAMFVALIKAGVVVGYFMHLKFDTRFYSFLFLGTLLFVGIFFLLTFVDLNTRDMMNPTWDTHVMANDMGITEQPALKDTVPLTDEERKAAESGGHH
jgi:cytochrome c oxidase subunit 4